MLTALLSIFYFLTAPAAVPSTAELAAPPPLCSCGPYVDDFCANVGINSTVILVSILEVDTVFRDNTLSQTMRVAVLDDLSGTAQSGELDILGGSGDFCEQNLRVFTAGDTAMLSVLQGGNAASYILSGLCGRHYAKVEDSRLEDRTLAAFKADFAACVAKTSSIAEVEQKAVVVTPDRAAQTVRIESPEEMIMEYALYNAVGQVVHARQGLHVHTATLPGHDLATGVYSVRIRTNVGAVTRRFYWAQ